MVPQQNDSALSRSEGSTVKITRRLEFDAGHRIPDHKSQCRHLHGHRYVVEISLTGQVLSLPGESSNGMVMDFSEVKEIAENILIKEWDHAFLVYEGDELVRNFLDSLPGHKTVVLDCIPTAENLARLAFRRLASAYVSRYGNHLFLSHLRLFETPNCWADVSA